MGEVVVAAVEPQGGASVDEAALLAWLGERLAPYQRPRAVRVMELPASADLKVKRRLVRELLAAGSGD
jgi:acyl-CoA synthetase (AMP-forming)/AMP-acid ligase II